MSMTIEQINRVLKAAANSSCSDAGRKRIEAIRCSTKQDAKSAVIVATGTWNNIYRFNDETQIFELIDDTPSRLAHLLERLGVELEWADEWLVCQTCGRLVRCRFDGIAEPVIRHCGNTTCETFGLRRDHGDGLPLDRFQSVRVFVVVSVSANRNQFGLRGMVVVAPDGEAWEVGANDLSSKKKGEVIQVPLLGRLRNFASLGFEMPKQLPDAPPEVVAAVWK
jgi:hypothetical protein